MRQAPTSWADPYDPRYKGRIIVPSLQNTEGLPNIFAAAALETGKSLDAAQGDAEPGFRKLAALKPNLLTVYTQQPQAYNLLEQGEAWMISSAMSSYALERKAAGAPIALAAPKEGVFAMPSGIAVVKGCPLPDLAFAYVDMLLGAELQQRLVGPTFSLPTNRAVPRPAGLPADLVVHQIDWANVARERDGWIK
ncbi:ABC transporter substrate-binding protein, partial [Methylobacterium frigidaeris]